jgi:RNA polymerase primary sigma factor
VLTCIVQVANPPKDPLTLRRMSQESGARASFARALADSPKPIGRDEEIALGRRMEDAEHALLVHQLSLHGVQPILELRDALECGDVRAHKIVRALDPDDPTYEEASVTLRALAALDAIARHRTEEALRAADLSRSTVRRLTAPATDAHARALFRELTRAKNELLRANVRLVASIASRREFQNRGLEVLDLIQEGTLGMMSAVDNFDWRRGFKFSTYATWWIRQALQRAIVEQSHTIRLPFGVAELQQKIGRVTRESLARVGREPTEEELAENLVVSVDRIRVAVDAKRVEPRSMHTPIGEDGELADLLADETLIAADEAAANTHRARVTDDALGTLTAREQHILRLRFGLGDEREHTLQEIADSLHLTRERIRQIEKRAVEKLRASFARGALNDV